MYYCNSVAQVKAGITGVTCDPGIASNQGKAGI